MTAQLSRVVYRIGSPENDQHHFTDQKDHADIAKNNGYEVSEYVLAGMDSEPVAYRWSYGENTNWRLTQHIPSHGDNDKCPRVIQPLYAAPPAPVAVPDKK